MTLVLNLNLIIQPGIRNYNFTIHQNLQKKI